MRRYHFDLLDPHTVTDASGAILNDDDQAMKVAQELVQSVRATRPELIGQGYEIVVRTDNGQEVWRTAVDRPRAGTDGA